MNSSLPEQQILVSESPTPTQPKQNSKKKQIILGVIFSLVFIICVFATIVVLPTKDSQPAKKITATINAIVIKPSKVPVPTPYPFYDLTIPFLREQKYESVLGEFEQVSENDSYISQVTSYTSNGLKINGLLTRPVGEEPEEGWPAIVFIHGYLPPNSYATLGQPYSSYVDYLARNGFVVFKIDLRGHGDSEGEPGGAYYSSDYIIDALNAYSALQSADFVNSKKIGIWGHSMSGNIALRSVAAHPDIPAVVIWAGAVYSYEDLNKYKISDASFDPSQSISTRTKKREQIRKLYGDPDISKPFWRDIAPTSYLSELKGAIQIHHSVDDAVVNIGYSRDLGALLDKTSIPHELHEYPNGGHNIEGSSFTTAMQRTVEFFEKYL